MPKTKAPRQSKEEILEGMKRKKEIDRKRILITDAFYPALINATISVDEAKALISAMGSLLMSEVLKTMKERQFSEISESLLKVLCTDGEREPEVRALLDTLKGENLFVARELIEGMTRAIEAMVAEEMHGRKLDTLKTNWQQYLN